MDTPDRITLNRVKIESQRCDVQPCPERGITRVRTEYQLSRHRRTHSTYLCGTHAKNFLTNLLEVWP